MSSVQRSLPFISAGTLCIHELFERRCRRLISTRPRARAVEALRQPGQVVGDVRRGEHAACSVGGGRAPRPGGGPSGRGRCRAGLALTVREGEPVGVLAVPVAERARSAACRSSSRSGPPSAYCSRSGRPVEPVHHREDVEEAVVDRGDVDLGHGVPEACPGQSDQDLPLARAPVGRRSNTGAEYFAPSCRPRTSRSGRRGAPAPAPTGRAG